MIVKRLVGLLKTGLVIEEVIKEKLFGCEALRERRLVKAPGQEKDPCWGDLLFNQRLHEQALLLVELPIFFLARLRTIPQVATLPALHQLPLRQTDIAVRLSELVIHD